MNYIFSRLYSLLFSFFISVGVSGCGAVNVLEASRVIYDDDLQKIIRTSGKNDIRIPQYKDDWFLEEMSKRFGLMAFFALVVYGCDEDLLDKYPDACKNTLVDNTSKFGMPYSDNEKIRWERWCSKNVDSCFNGDGLFYETYVLRGSEGGYIEKAVVAYRGTESTPDQRFHDWSSNFAAAIGLEPKQYKLARERLPKLINQLKLEGNPNKPPLIYAVGHSLGGGLAQQAGYLSGDIKEVYTFNTSPVTNWSYLRMYGLIERGYPVIHRIYNGGEGLAGIRSIATASTATRYGRHDVGIQFGEKSIVGGHSMKVLACGFAQVLSEMPKEQLPHDYPYDYIKNHVWGPGKSDEEKKSMFCYVRN